MGSDTDAYDTFECTWKINGKKGKSNDESGEDFAEAIAKVMGVEMWDLMEWFENKYGFSIVRASDLELKGTKGDLESFDGEAYEID